MADTPIAIQLDRYRDAALAAFEQHLEQAIRRAQQATLDYMTRHLTLVDGVITRTPANLKLLRRLNQIFMTELDRVGYSNLVNAFVGEFPGQLAMMQEMTRQLAQAARTPLPNLDFTTRDLNLFKSVAVTSAQHLRQVIETEAQRALSKVMFSVGGLPFRQMVQIVMDQGLGATVARARVVADTASAMFYRTAQEHQYQKIEAATGKPLLYRYTGPNDRRCRPFCHRMKNGTKKAWTRAEIDQMDNDQLPNVFITGGGYLCRHQFDLAGLAN